MLNQLMTEEEYGRMVRDEETSRACKIYGITKERAEYILYELIDMQLGFKVELNFDMGNFREKLEKEIREATGIKEENIPVVSLEMVERSKDKPFQYVRGYFKFLPDIPIDNIIDIVKKCGGKLPEKNSWGRKIDEVFQ